MEWLVQELTELTLAREAVLALSKVNSAHLDIDAEAQLPHARFWIALETPSANAVAYALIWLVGNEVEIIDVATAAPHRRRGAARALLNALLDAYARSARDAAFLEVRAGNHAALGLYAQLGFERTRERRGYYSNGEDAVEMRRDLTALRLTGVSSSADQWTPRPALDAHKRVKP